VYFLITKTGSTCFQCGANQSLRLLAMDAERSAKNIS